MYAIIRSGGKQYRVQAGDLIRVEKLQQNIGTEFDLTDILFLHADEPLIGSPELSETRVTLHVTRQSKAPKMRVFKKKRRQGYKRTQGHRQCYTELFVKEITGPNGQVSRAEIPKMKPSKTKEKKATTTKITQTTQEKSERKNLSSKENEKASTQEPQKTTDNNDMTRENTKNI